MNSQISVMNLSQNSDRFESLPKVLNLYREKTEVLN
jgi:hypothetical protein